MPRDLAVELDLLRSEVHQLSNQVGSLLRAAQSSSAGEPGRDDHVQRLAVDSASVASNGPADAAPDRTEANESVVRRTDALVASAREQGLRGALTYAGFYTTSDSYGSRESRWLTEQVAADELLAQSDAQVGRVLAALGNRQRLGVLKAILEKPSSAAVLVEQLGMGTTGQAYHHLKALQAADLIELEDRGRFVVKPYRVQAFLLLLAGVRDMLDARYSSGTWSDDPAAA